MRLDEKGFAPAVTLQALQGQISALWLPSCAIWGQLLNPSVPQGPHLYMGPF